MKVLVLTVLALASFGTPAVWSDIRQPLAILTAHGPQQLSRPTGLALASNGSLLTSDVALVQVFEFGPDGGALGRWGVDGGDPGQFRLPVGIELDGSDRAFVADPDGYPGSGLQVFSTGGALIEVWGSRGVGPGLFFGPKDVAFGPDGSVFVVDRARVQVFTPGGAFITQWGEIGSGPGQFDQPAGITVGPTGEVFVTDIGLHRVSVFTSSGSFVRHWGQMGTGAGDLHGPQGVAADPAGRVYVTDTVNNRVQVFTSGGEFLMEWGRRGSAPGEFDHPWDIEITSDERVIVSDPWNRRIQIFGPLATPTRETSWGQIKTLYR